MLLLLQSDELSRYGEETHSTLKFASKAKKIQNCTQVNEVLDDAALMRRYKKEISELRTQIASTGQRHRIFAFCMAGSVSHVFFRSWRQPGQDP